MISSLLQEEEKQLHRLIKIQRTINMTVLGKYARILNPYTSILRSICFWKISCNQESIVSLLKSSSFKLDLLKILKIITGLNKALRMLQKRMTQHQLLAVLVK